MMPEDFSAERTWLKEYVRCYCDELEVTAEAEKAMTNERVWMADILNVLSDPEVVSADREQDGCHFTVKGRDCDDDIIVIQGMFNSGIQSVSVFDVTRSHNVSH